MKKITVSVINDLVSDQRVNRSCSLLYEMGFEVLLIGRKRRKSPPLSKRKYRTLRMRLLFETGPLFYAEFNIRLFLILLFKKQDILFANDLDTLLANHVISKLLHKPLIYDSHEYFTETPELVNRPNVKRIWKSIERSIFPKLKEVITVNKSIATLFEKEYGNTVSVIRNVPQFREPKAKYSKQELGIPEEIPILILQGAGINIDRGAEELIEAMPHISKSCLLIVGDGDVINTLKARVIKLNIASRVLFFPRQDFEHLHSFTMHADIGFSLDKNSNLNYQFSLPNKLFDYIQGGTAVVASKLPEIENVIKKYTVGVVIKEHNPKVIAETVNALLSNPLSLEKYKANALIAAQELCWDSEQKVLKEIIKRLNP